MAQARRSYLQAAGKHFKIDKFTVGYLNAAFFSSTDESDEGGGEPLDQNYSWTRDLGLDAAKGAIKDCANFQKYEAEDLAESGLSDERAGELFWLNRNGHGVGYWDDPGGAVGNRLSKAAHVYGSVDLYVGDDGKIHGN